MPKILITNNNILIISQNATRHRQLSNDDFYFLSSRGKRFSSSFLNPFEKIRIQAYDTYPGPPEDFIKRHKKRRSFLDDSNWGSPNMRCMNKICVTWQLFIRHL